MKTEHTDLGIALWRAGEFRSARNAGSLISGHERSTIALADEIERLRGENQQMRQLFEVWTTAERAFFALTVSNDPNKPNLYSSEWIAISQAATTAWHATERWVKNHPGFGCGDPP